MRATSSCELWTSSAKVEFRTNSVARRFRKTPHLISASDPKPMRQTKWLRETRLHRVPFDVYS